jgi:hypothetical protein
VDNFLEFEEIHLSDGSTIKVNFPLENLNPKIAKMILTKENIEELKEKGYNITDEQQTTNCSKPSELCTEGEPC